MIGKCPKCGRSGRRLLYAAPPICSDIDGCKAHLESLPKKEQKLLEESYDDICKSLTKDYLSGIKDKKWY